MLQGKSGASRAALRGAIVCALACVAAYPADAPLVPLTVCEVMRNLPAHDGKTIAILGRYSFRFSGRLLAEQACEPAAAVPPQFRMVEDAKDGPKLPDSYELDGAELRRKVADMLKRTSLGKFRFGSADYDRWAVVYGRVEAPKADDAQKTPSLAYRGEGVIMFLGTQ